MSNDKLLEACRVYWRFRESGKEIPGKVIADYITSRDEVIRKLVEDSTNPLEEGSVLTSDASSEIVTPN